MNRTVKTVLLAVGILVVLWSVFCLAVPVAKAQEGEGGLDRNVIEVGVLTAHRLAPKGAQFSYTHRVLVPGAPEIGIPIVLRLPILLPSVEYVHEDGEYKLDAWYGISTGLSAAVASFLEVSGTAGLNAVGLLRATDSIGDVGLTDFASLSELDANAGALFTYDVAFEGGFRLHTKGLFIGAGLLVRNRLGGDAAPLQPAVEVQSPDLSDADYTTLTLDDAEGLANGSVDTGEAGKLHRVTGDWLPPTIVISVGGLF